MVTSNALRITTGSGTIYELSAPGADGFRTVTRNGQLHCEGKVAGSGLNTILGAMLMYPNALIEGASLMLETREHGPYHYWCSTAICTIEELPSSN